MANGKPLSFRVGLIQMRSGRTLQANIDTAAKLIGEARNRGAEYVLTPEMTNIMETGRERFFASIVAEEQDPALKLLRNLQTRGAGMLAVDVPPPVRDEAESMLSLYIHYLLERRPSSAAFLETLRRAETA